MSLFLYYLCHSGATFHLFSMKNLRRRICLYSHSMTGKDAEDDFKHNEVVWMLQTCVQDAVQLSGLGTR